MWQLTKVFLNLKANDSETETTTSSSELNKNWHVLKEKYIYIA